MTPEEHERITSEIARRVFEEVEGIPPSQVRYGRQNLWQGVSGYPHQIDVSVVGTSDLILIECKKWTAKVSVDAVLTFLGRLIDIRPMFGGTVHGVFVTTKQVQPAARTIAEYYDIDLQVIESPERFGFKYKNANWRGVGFYVPNSMNVSWTKTSGQDTQG